MAATPERSIRESTELTLEDITVTARIVSVVPIHVKGTLVGYYLGFETGKRLRTMYDNPDKNTPRIVAGQICGFELEMALNRPVTVYGCEGKILGWRGRPF